MNKFTLILLFFYINISAQITINGNNFTNLIDAQNYVRTINDNMTNDIIVNISAGTYTLTETLEFTSEDSGTNNHNIIYQAADPNNKPIISGGFKIPQSNWVPHNANENIWKVNINNRYSRQIYNNGVKLKRAKSDGNYDLIEKTNGYFAFCNTPDDFFNWNMTDTISESVREIRQRDIEIVSNNEWKSNRIPVQSKCQSQLNVNDTIWSYNHKQQFKCGNKSAWIENTYELINTPNEWYIDRSGSLGNILYLKTSNNQPPQDVIIPQIESLIIANDVTNLIFDGLNFQYTNWNEPSKYLTTLNSNKGLALVQADWYYDIQSNASISGNIISSAIIFQDNCNKITFTNNIFENLGAIGLQFLKNCNNNNICTNVFKNICASAISIGFPESNTGMNNLISNNLIDNIATEYSGSVGIFVSTAKNTKILNNEISNFPYSGISIGWGWSSTFDTGTNIISNNKIDCSFQFMSDTAAIYTLGKQGTNSTKTQINNNYIINFHRRFGAIYLDQGSTNFEIYKNIIEADTSYTTFDTYINWINITGYDASNIEYYDNYFSSQYLSVPITPPSPQLDLPVTLTDYTTINIMHSPTSNIYIDDADPTTIDGIINNSGIQQSPNCQY